MSQRIRRTAAVGNRRITHCFLRETLGFFPDNPYYQERFYGVEIRFWRFTDGSEGGFCLGGARAKPVGRRGRCQKAYCWCHEHSLLTGGRWLKIRRVRGCYFDYSSRLPGMTRRRAHFSRARASTQHLRQLAGARPAWRRSGDAYDHERLHQRQRRPAAWRRRTRRPGSCAARIRSSTPQGFRVARATTRVAGARPQQRVAA